MLENIEQDNTKIEWLTEKRALHELLPASYNPRKMTKKQNEDLKASLEKFSLAEIPVINTDNTIIAGHQRVRVLADLYGHNYIIDVRVPTRTLSIDEEKEYNVRSNKNTGDWDWDILANEFDTEELLDWGFAQSDLESNSFGFSEEELTAETQKKPYLIKVSFKTKEDLENALYEINNISKTYTGSNVTVSGNE